MAYDSGFIRNNTGSGAFTFATLPSGSFAATIPVGVQAYTTDQGIATWDGQNWSTAKLLIRKHPFVPKGMANVQSVMASPPTVAISTTNPLAGQFISAVVGAQSTRARRHALPGDVPGSWPAGTIITPCPGCYMTGNGHQGATTGVGNADNLVFTDGIHPSPAGHLMLGALLGQAYASSLNT